MARDDRLLIALLVCAAVLTLAGCIFPEDKVTVDIRGVDQINPNTTHPTGLKIQVNNEIDQDIKGMRVVFRVPENIVFVGYVMGKPLNKTVEAEPGKIIWAYSFTADLAAGEQAEYTFSYTPVVYEHDFGGGNEYSYQIRVQVYDSDGNSLGNQTATWRVTRPL